MKKPVKKPKQKIKAGKVTAGGVIMAISIPVATVAVVAVAATVINKPVSAPEPPAATSTSLLVILPTEPPPTATVEPTITPTAEPTFTLTPDFAIFGTWLPDEGSTTWIINNPPPGKFCSPGMHQWFPWIIIEETSNSNGVIIKGLHEHLEFREGTLDPATMTIIDTKVMPEINETSVTIFEVAARRQVVCGGTDHRRWKHLLFGLCLLQ